MKFRRRRGSEEIAGFLDKGTSLTGELQFSGQLQIHGNFHGSITTNDILVIGEHAVIHADIRAGEIEIHGSIFGNIEAKRRIEIHPKGRVQGDVESPMLVINPGAIFDGRSRMVGEKEETNAGQIASPIGKVAGETH